MTCPSTGKSLGLMGRHKPSLREAQVYIKTVSQALTSQGGYLCSHYKNNLGYDDGNLPNIKLPKENALDEKCKNSSW